MKTRKGARIMEKPDYMKKRGWGLIAIARAEDAVLCLEKYVEDLDKGELHWRTVPSEKSNARFVFFSPIPTMTEIDFLKEVKRTGKLPAEILSLYPTPEVKNTESLLLWAKIGEFLLSPFAGQ